MSFRQVFQNILNEKYSIEILLSLSQKRERDNFIAKLPGFRGEGLEGLESFSKDYTGNNIGKFTL